MAVFRQDQRLAVVPSQFGNMSRKDTSPPLGPFWAMLAALALLAMACLLLWQAVAGLKAGEILSFSKHRAGIVLRSDTPGSFWASEMCYSFFGLMLASLSFKILKGAFRGGHA